MNEQKFTQYDWALMTEAVRNWEEQEEATAIAATRIIIESFFPI